MFVVVKDRTHVDRPAVCMFASCVQHVDGRVTVSNPREISPAGSAHTDRGVKAEASFAQEFTRIVRSDEAQGLEGALTFTSDWAVTITDR